MGTSKIIESLWASDADVTMKTDTDIQQRRTESSRLSDPSGHLHRLLDTLVAETSLPNRSAAADRALRVEVARAIDDREVPFTREEYDVAYSIPPASWVNERVFPEIDLFPESDVDVEDRTINMTTKPACYEMAQAVVEAGVYETITDLVTAGAERLLGR